MGKEIIGLDTVLFIYLLEANRDYAKPVRALFRSIESGEKRGVFSSVGMIELLTGVKKQNRWDLAAQYKEYLGAFPNLSIVGINERIVDYASDLRAKYGILTPDAIHIATAIDAGAKQFATNDRSLACVREIKIYVLA
ncbi:MAG: type II toxin-antitoxin system VapC family toxin [Candidatus Wildermuthbacteria bacterium]|nr:type II toxin-antitoxin system VapC family toxin [Candidatus Wildermuthbacteria bacterium]